MVIKVSMIRFHIRSQISELTEKPNRTKKFKDITKIRARDTHGFFTHGYFFTSLGAIYRLSSMSKIPSITNSIFNVRSKL